MVFDSIDFHYYLSPFEMNCSCTESAFGIVLMG